MFRRITKILNQEIIQKNKLKRRIIFLGRGNRTYDFIRYIAICEKKLFWIDFWINWLKDYTGLFLEDNARKIIVNWYWKNVRELYKKWNCLKIFSNLGILIHVSVIFCYKRYCDQEVFLSVVYSYLLFIYL